jgi:hypothetical protein
MPVIVAARSKTWTVFARSDASRSQWPRGLRHELPSLARTLAGHSGRGLRHELSSLSRTLAERPKAWTVFARSDASRSQWPRSKTWTVFALWDPGTLGSWVRIPFKSYMFCTCMHLLCVCVVLCLGWGLATGWSLVQRVLPSVENDYGTE